MASLLKGRLSCIMMCVFLLANLLHVGHNVLRSAEEEWVRDGALHKGDIVTISERPFVGKRFNLEGPWQIQTSDDQDSVAIQQQQSVEPWNSSTLTDYELSWLMSQKERRRLVRKVCSEQKQSLTLHELSKDGQFSRNMILDPKHVVLYCPVGKVACTSWKTALAMLQGSYTGLKPGEHIHEYPVLRRNGLRTLQMKDNRENILANSPSFLFVRHPFERLISAFRNKFHAVNKENMQHKYGREIIRRYRINATTQSLESGGDVRFSEFVSWLLDNKVKNVHWDQFDDICHLCTLPYTFIGHMDTFEEDTKNILRFLFDSRNMTMFPHANSSPDRRQDELETYFEDISDHDMSGLKEMYELDFKMFGYSWPRS